MSFSLLIILIIITCLVSYQALNDNRLAQKLVYSPYLVKHDNEWYRVISHILIHGDFTHLAFNMLSLYMLGQWLEFSLMATYGTQLGEIHFFMIYLLGGIAAAIIPFIRNQNNPNYSAVGASGAVSAVVFAFILWWPTAPLNMMFIPIDIPAFIFGPVYLLIEYLLHRRGGTGIAHDAHIGGALFGVIYVLIINIDKGKEFIQTIFNYF